MGALPYKTNGSLKRREPYRIKQMGVLKGGSPTARNRKTAVLLATQLFYLRFENMVKLNLYYIDMKYVRNLSHVDDHVMSVSPQRQKQSRPFVGIVIMLNGRNYCIPMSSPKAKFQKMKSQMDLIKIFDNRHKDSNGSPKLIGVLNINNMIPVDKAVISDVDLRVSPKDDRETQRYKELMQMQIKFCRQNADVILSRARKVYDLVMLTPEKHRNLTRRCLNFAALESILEEYLAKSEVYDYEEQIEDETEEEEFGMAMV